MRNVRASRLVYGLATFLPGVYRHFSMPPMPVGEIAMDGYSKWLHHLIAVAEGPAGERPRTVAEIGPGPSCSAGVAALVSGCARYTALDVVEFPDQPVMAAVFEETCRLFSRRTPLREWLGILPARPFPDALFPEDRFRELMDPSRLARLKRDLEAPHPDGAMQVIVPWHRRSLIREGSLDLVFSTAAMEHVDDLETAYRAMNLWVRPSGLMSHVIDYGCHNACHAWNGHWACPEPLWRVLRGNRPYFINRQPHSAHVALLRKHGFTMVSEKFLGGENRFGAAQFAPAFRDRLTDDDKVTHFSFFQARKNNPADARA